ncbi:hypothetical protein [Terriglobus sp. ADX1]|uniref:hypothetical protein n=1 Tax=Terriglobus sp. ADX1 TaxID=2794063 RepID=UPI002FE57A7F
MSVITKTVEVEVDTYEHEYRRALNTADALLDTLVERGIVMHLSPAMRNEVVHGMRDLRSVLV